MTTIAFRDGVMAADSATTRNGIHVADTKKIVTDKKNGIIAVTGDLSDMAKIHQWFQSGADTKALGQLKVGDCEALLIKPDGKSFNLIGPNLVVLEIFFTVGFALGSGSEIALGAMAYGATAEEAIHICCDLDGYSKGPVQVERLTSCQIGTIGGIDWGKGMAPDKKSTA